MDGVSMAAGDGTMLSPDGDGVQFTDRELRLIGVALPDGVEKSRLDLLPLILSEWRRTEFPEHRRQKPEPAEVRRSRWERLVSVETHARQLAEVLAVLDENEPWEIIFHLASPLEQYPQCLSTRNIEQAQRELEATHEWSPRLATAAHEAALPYAPQKRPALSNVPYRVLLDIAG